MGYTPEERDKYIRDLKASRRDPNPCKKLDDRVKNVVGDRRILGFVSGVGLINKLIPTIVLTDIGVLFYDPKWTGEVKAEIPFAQITSATYKVNFGVPTFSVDSQSGKTELMLYRDDEIREDGLNLFRMLRNKMSEIAGVPISEGHDKGLFKQTWTFYAPPKIAVMQTVTDKKEPSSEEDIPGKIMKLSELHHAGVLSLEEYENKKTELLKRL